MKKKRKLLRMLVAVLAAAACFAAGLLAAGFKPDQRQKAAKRIQEQLADSIFVPAEVKTLEEISLDVDLSARGDVYMERATVLQNMYVSAENRNEYFLIKLMEILPASEVSQLNRSYGEPSEYIALYLYGTLDRNRHMKYALQWGDVIVALDEWMLEDYHMEIVKGRIYGAAENSEILVIWNYDGFCMYTFVKEEDTITQYNLWGNTGMGVQDVYSIDASGREVTVYTHDTALTVTAEDEDQWDKKIFGGMVDPSPKLTVYAYIQACGEDENPLTARKTHVARLYGSIYLDTENNQFIIKDFYLTK